MIHRPRTWQFLPASLFFISTVINGHGLTVSSNIKVTSVNVYFTSWDLDYYTPPLPGDVRKTAAYHATLFNKVGYLDPFLRELRHLKCRPRPVKYRMGNTGMVIDVLSDRGVEYTLSLNKHTILISGNGNDLLCDASLQFIDSVRIPFPDDK